MTAEHLQSSRAAIGSTVGLVLPGGGARAAYQVGVLKAIADMLPQAPNPFPIIVGTSAGAVSAAPRAVRQLAAARAAGSAPRLERPAIQHRCGAPAVAGAVRDQLRLGLLGGIFSGPRRYPRVGEPAARRPAPRTA